MPPAQSVAKGQLAVIEAGEHGFKSITFGIDRFERVKAEDGTDALLVWFGGLWAGRSAHAGLSLSLDWQATDPKVPIPIWTTSMGLVRTGPQSDALVSQLGNALAQPIATATMKEDVFLVAVSLGGRPAVDATQFRLKVFNEGTSPAEYAEFYLRIDLDASIVILAEKDPEYRAPLMRAFTSAP